ncbi:MAG: NAD(P)-binding protein [Chloroflexi bacterium]|nr:NAD(P)-binding protein [Chloroflexota bacterium]
MEYLVQGLQRSVFDAEPLEATLARHLDLPEVQAVTVEREALDARRKNRIVWVYTLRFSAPQMTPRLQTLLAAGAVTPYTPPPMTPAEPRLTLPEQPAIVGFGPAGMFAALFLARAGYRPLVFERGEEVAARARSVARLWETGELNPESNMQFGEGGAGTFSDGKLTTGKAAPLDRLVLETLAAAGAPPTILSRAKPHVGTDYLRRVVQNIRQEIVDAGGEVRFGHCFTDLHLREGRVEAITVNGARLPTSCLVLAVGHSARDTVRLLQERGVRMEAKPFAVGVRVEHPAAFINERQYGAAAAAVLPAADYKLTYQHGGRGVYSFCMCPGGQVVCAASEPGGQVTNGMSRYARDGAYSNSALVVGLDLPALGVGSALEAMALQQGWEQAAFRAGGGGFWAPAQRATDFLAARVSRRLPESTYRPGIRPADLRQVLPTVVADGLAAGLARFDRLMPGFVAQGLLVGVESRTSSPVRILRDDDCQSVSTPGLFLLGEGAGYAGGIVTCARDALRFARLVRPRG